MSMSKISIVGAGMVGSTTAQRLAEREAGEIVLLDILGGVARGKALDIRQAGAAVGYDTPIRGTDDYQETVDSDIVIVTAGFPRKPGMSREELLKTNGGIVREIASKIVEYSPGALVIVVTNPLDVMTFLTLKVTGFPRERVMGMSGVLDSLRMASFIAEELGVSVKDVSALVLGGHGDTMLPLARYTSVQGVPLVELLEAEQVARIVERTIHGGAEIVGLLQTGSAFYAPAAAITVMVEAILKDKNSLLPVSAYLQGEYGEKDLCLGVPVKLGRKGIKEILELPLTDEEKTALAKSADTVKKGIDSLKGLGLLPN